MCFCACISVVVLTNVYLAIVGLPYRHAVRAGSDRASRRTIQVKTRVVRTSRTVIFRSDATDVSWYVLSHETRARTAGSPKQVVRAQEKTRSGVRLKHRTAKPSG